MRLAIVSDTHTVDSFEKIYNHLLKLTPQYAINGVVINGDMLGLFNIKEEYGQKHKPNMTKLLQSHAPFTNNQILIVFKKIQEGQELDENSLKQFSEMLKDYIDERYMWLLNSLRKLSNVTKVYYNLGDHESPLHYKVIDELAFTLGLEKDMINQILKNTDDRNHFEQFKNKLKELEKTNDFIFISQKVIDENGILIAGIPGLHNNPEENSELSQAQENVTVKILDEIKTKIDNAKALIIFNHIDGKINSKPFLFEPSSLALKSFLATTKNNIPKLLCQSNHTFVTTHFYKNNEWFYLLNNAGVNNGLYNVIDIHNDIKCYDIDPNLNQIINLTKYNLEEANYTEPIQRMKLNYPDTLKIMTQRKIDNHIDNL